jgi:hypothetical protein
MEEEKKDEKIFINQQEVSKEKYTEIIQDKSKRLIQEDDNHFRVLERMND